MNTQFIIDKEINLNDCDFLKTKVYSDSLTEVIKNTEDNKVFTIGLFGGWGTGKSSIIETAKQYFDPNKVRFITYDAWQYANDSFRRMFLLKIQEELKQEPTENMNRFYESTTAEAKPKQVFNVHGLAGIIIALIAAVFITETFVKEIEYKISIISFFTLLGLLITVLNGCFHNLKISITKPLLFAPEQFENCFKQMMAVSLKKEFCLIKYIRNGINYVTRGDTTVSNLDKIVIVIDNIDRCSSDVAYNLLADIKTFLSPEPYSIVFVIPVDDEALCNHINNRNKKNEINNKSDTEAELLRKLFNVTIRIKPYGETDMYAFANSINDKFGLNLRKETINLTAKEYSKNPRRVIQLFNNLFAEFTLYKDDVFVKKNEILICSIIIMREEYNDYYRAVIDAPTLFVDSKISPTNAGTDTDSKDTQYESNLRRFIRIAHSTIGTIDLTDFTKVLTNTENIFVSINSNIRDAVETFDATKILDVFSTEKNNVTNYLIYKMSLAIKNNLIERELTSLCELVYQINNVHPFGIDENKRFIEKMVEYLETIVRNSEKCDEMCVYALALEKQGIYTFKRTIVSILTDSKIDEQADQYTEDLFNAVLKHFQDSVTSEKLSAIYTERCRFLDASIKLSNEQWSYLVSDEFVQQRINIMEDINQNTARYKLVQKLFKEKRNISTDTYAVFFNKVETLMGEMRGKTKEEIVNVLQFVNPYIELIDNFKLNNEPQNLYNLIVNYRKMPNVNAIYQNPQYDQSLNFIDECIAEQDNVSDIVDFIIGIYRITAGKIEISTEIKKLVEHNRDEMNKQFMKLIEIGFNLKPILSLVFQDNNYENNNTIALLKHCFNQKDDNGDYCLSKSDITDKLSNMLDCAITEQNSTIFELLESLAEQELYKELLSNLIIEHDSDAINSLPKNLLCLALNNVTNDNYGDFNDNFDFLFVIAQRGNIDHKKLLIKLLIQKIDTNNKVDKVLNIIDLINNIYEVDPDGLLSTHLKKYKRESGDDELKRHIDKITLRIKKESN